MATTGGFGQITDACFSSLNVNGDGKIAGKLNARRLNARSGKIQNDFEICGDLIVKGAIIQEQSQIDSEACDVTFEEKLAELNAVEAEYKNNGTVSWGTFALDQVGNQKKVVTLTQADFANGTLRVQHPCLLKLTESVQFNPNRPTTWLDAGDMQTIDFNDAVKIDPNRVLDWFPDNVNVGGGANDQYFEPEVRFAYGLGFFAAIAIESEDPVIFDLSGYTISQHPEHALQQRFFAVIELADQPFIPLQGPSNFGAVLRSAKNCMIKNGKIGLSSHHGIHGNDCDEVLLHNLQFEDFEVAAISLNGCNGLYMKNVNALKSNDDVPVLGTYSAARFVERFVKMVQAMTLSTTELDDAMGTLKADMEEAFNDIIFDNGTISDLFKNTEGVVDGTCYGFLVNPKGVAVNTFLNDRNTPKAFETTNVHMINCSVNNLKGNIREIIGLANPEGGMQVDTAGALLQFFNGVSSETSGKYTYAGTTLSEVQIELSKIKKDLDDAMTNTSFLGTLNIHPGIHFWQTDTSNYFEFIEEGSIQLFYSNTDPIMIEGGNVIYDLKCNGDSMFHVNKGVIGYRIDGASTLCISNCSANNIENIGQSGSNLCGSYITSHPATEGTHCVGYTGSDCFGAVFNAVNDNKVANFNISNVVSANGCAHGIVVQNESVSSTFQDVIIGPVTSEAEFDGSRAMLPNIPGSAIGFGVRFGCKNINLNNVLVSGVNDETPFTHEFKITDSQGVTVD